MTLLVLLASCGHGKRKQDDETPHEVGPQPSITGKQIYDVPVGPQPLEGPPPPEGYKPADQGWVVILAPGLVRTIAYVGVLKQLEKSGLQINAIIGVGMGAVIGAIWSARGIAALEWNITKLNRDTFSDLPLFSLGGEREASGSKFERFLRGVLKNRTFKDLKIPLYVMVSDEEGKNVVSLNNGDLVLALRDAVATRGLMRPRQNGARSAVDVNPVPTEFAKSLGVGKVLVVEAMAPVTSNAPQESFEERVNLIMKRVYELAQRGMRDADAVLSIPASDVSYLDTKMRAELAYRGRKATEQWLMQVNSK